jgi:cytochrome bd-type quinol oxidase subunit 2
MALYGPRSLAVDDDSTWQEAAGAVALLATLFVLFAQWLVLTIASLNAPPLRQSCVYPCEGPDYIFSGWTFFLLLPELVLGAGLLGALIRRRARPYLYGAAAAVAAVIIVAVLVFHDPHIRHGLPPGPLFGIGLP